MIMKMYADSKHAPLWLEIKQPQGCGTSIYAFCDSNFTLPCFVRYYRVVKIQLMHFVVLTLFFHIMSGTSKTMKKDMQNLVVISNEVKLETNEKI